MAFGASNGHMNSPESPPNPALDPASAAAWVFDLDNTLYPVSHGLFDQIDRRIKEYVADFLDINHEAAYRIQKTYFREHGTTLRGLMDRHNVDPVAFLDYVHDIDISVVPPAPELGRALDRIKGRKLIFTNADTAHAERILARLGIAHHFEAIFDIVDAEYTPKPALETYTRLAERYRLKAGATVMVEDIARNLGPARAMGWATVWVRSGSACEVASEAPEVAADIDFITDDLTAWLGAI